MPPGHRTDLEKAALAGALSDSGLNRYQIARQVGIPRRTVVDILLGRNDWDKLTSDPSFRAHRLALKRKHQLANLDLQSQLLGQIERKVEDMTAYQAAGSYGILFDKERLMAGESTENVATLGYEDIAALKAELARRAQPIDTSNTISTNDSPPTPPPLRRS